MAGEGGQGVGVELIIFVSFFNPEWICKPLASTSKAGGFLFRAFGPQHTKVLKTPDIHFQRKRMSGVDFQARLFYNPKEHVFFTYYEGL